MAWIIPVFDRSGTDITNKTSKGFFNVIDWVRINGNTEYVAALINVLRGVNLDLNSVTPPTVTSFPSAGDINDFVENIEDLRVALGLPVTTELVSLKHDYQSGGTVETPDYEDVNNWEKNLDNLKKFLVNSSYFEVFSGVASTGQVRFYQSQWRTPFIRESLSPVRRPRCGIASAGFGAMRNNKFRRYD